MLLLFIPLVFAAATFALYRYFRKKRDVRALWRASITIGLSVGIVRAVLACVGWYVVEHTGGPLQTPAFLLALLSWPEAIVFGSHRGVAPLQFYFLLGFLLIATTLVFFCAIAFVVQVTSGQRDA